MFDGTIWNTITALSLTSGIIWPFHIEFVKITDPEHSRVSLFYIHSNKDKYRKDLWWVIFFLCSQRRVFHLACQRSFYLTVNCLNKVNEAAEKIKYGFLKLNLRLGRLKTHSHIRMATNNPPFCSLYTHFKIQAQHWGINISWDISMPTKNNNENNNSRLQEDSRQRQWLESEANISVGSNEVIWCD